MLIKKYLASRNRGSAPLNPLHTLASQVRTEVLVQSMVVECLPAGSWNSNMITGWDRYMVIFIVTLTTEGGQCTINPDETIQVVVDEPSAQSVRNPTQSH